MVALLAGFRPNIPLGATPRAKRTKPSLFSTALESRKSCWQMFGDTHILVSLEPLEVIFWMRSWPSSVFSSPNCLRRSSLFFDHNAPALILPDD